MSGNVLMDSDWLYLNVLPLSGSCWCGKQVWPQPQTSAFKRIISLIKHRFYYIFEHKKYIYTLPNIMSDVLTNKNNHTLIDEVTAVILYVNTHGLFIYYNKSYHIWNRIQNRKEIDFTKKERNWLNYGHLRWYIP